MHDVDDEYRVHIREEAVDFRRRYGKRVQTSLAGQGIGPCEYKVANLAGEVLIKCTVFPLRRIIVLCRHPALRSAYGKQGLSCYSVNNIWWLFRHGSD